MDKFIYSIKEIFDVERGCLEHYGVDGYYIAPYQRGYKWKSNGVHDQIPVLLIDLYEAFNKSQKEKLKQEYYLQYITVKKNESNLFEVIDGQQRLTSLTLLFNVLEEYYSDILKKSGVQLNITKANGHNLLGYSRYPDENVFATTINNLNDNSIDENNLKEQDKYYMLKASMCFKLFFDLLIGENNANEGSFISFVKFIQSDVKLILNKEDELSTAEEIFSNLNDNKVALTNAYLIKGLLLTKASRYSSVDSKNMHFKEIIDQRAIMGRTWDEMNTWLSNEEISLFFFGTKKDGLEKMLDLIRFEVKSESTPIIDDFKNTFKGSIIQYFNPFILFNNYQEKIITTQDAVLYLLKIKHIYKRLKSWYYDNETYNLIGYYQAVTNFKAKNIDGYSKNISNFLEFDSNEKIKDKIKAFVLDKLPKPNVTNNLGYKNYNPTLFALLAINVFPQFKDKNIVQNYRFDFKSFQDENWSLEHIFPQNPELNDFKIENDSKWIIEQINIEIKKQEAIQDDDPKKSDELNRLTDIIDRLKSDSIINSNEISFIFESIDNVDDLGNMALLSGKVNSSLSNGFFNTKRKILIEKINRGSFVPKHTIDVFSKMLEIDKVTHPNLQFEDTLTIWSNSDIETHKQWLIDSLKDISESFKNKMV